MNRNLYQAFARRAALLCFSLGVFHTPSSLAGNAQLSAGDTASTHPETPIPRAALIRGSKVRIADIPLAENTLFTADGRLIVSGGANVYEITATTNNQYVATPIYAGTDNFTGMAQIGATLYVTSYTGMLYAADLSSAPLQLQRLMQLNMNAANGMTTDGTVLYIVNGPFPTGAAPDPKIERVSFSLTNPLQITEDLPWLIHGLFLPNGLKYNHGTLYLTDSSLAPFAAGVVKKVVIQSDGTPGWPELLSVISMGIPDDLAVIDQPDGTADILVAKNTADGVAMLNQDGVILGQTAPGTFARPSSVRLGQAPLFSSSVWLVTEKGDVFGNGASPKGNALSIFTPDP